MQNLGQQPLLQEILAHISHCGSYCIYHKAGEECSYLPESLSLYPAPLSFKKSEWRMSVIFILHVTELGGVDMPSNTEHTEIGLSLFSGISKLLWST